MSGTTNKRVQLNFFAVQETASEPSLLTPWSLVHAFAGAAAKEAGIQLLHWELIHGAYELKDQIVNLRGDVLNSLWNSVGDTASTTVGHMLVNTKGKLGLWALAFVVSWAGAITLGDNVG